MKKKQIPMERKLFLHKETLASLNKAQQENVHGGANTRQLIAACVTYTLSTVDHRATCQDG
jgi:hypothetical protein